MALPTISDLAGQLAAGNTTSERLVTAALDKIDTPAGRLVFRTVQREQALVSARASDAARRVGVVPSPLAGLPISLKDLFDVAGEETQAASPSLQGSPRALEDCPVVARLRAAGAILIGRTNMTEFAFGALGINPHFGTPANPADPARIPGGSSSGAAASVGAGMAVAAIGSDTGGSVRIPAALCGLVGLKPSQRRVPLDGVLPLSPSLDSIGPLAASVACCIVVDAVLAGLPPLLPDAMPVAGLRFGVPERGMLEHLDPTVAEAFGRAINALTRQGAFVGEAPWFSEDEDRRRAEAHRVITAVESYAWHRPILATHRERYDPRVLVRIAPGEKTTAAEYLDALELRGDLQRKVARFAQRYDALLWPACPIVAPRLADITSDAEYFRVNGLLLSNTAPVNFLNGCAISLPCQQAGELPVGLMLTRLNGADSALHSIALGVEEALAPPA
jgi:aspartyl-tRNA(Asn)/glutamyl-tRNA(Gln) amidotransferase subunit A